MHDLQALMTSRDFWESRYVKVKKAKDVQEIILDKEFWKYSLVITKVVEPLMRVRELLIWMRSLPSDTCMMACTGYEMP